MVANYLDQKVARKKALPPEQQVCWEVDGDLLVERAIPEAPHFGPDTRFHYLVRHGLLVVENIHIQPPHDHWDWFMHVADIYFDQARECWISQDLFVDILVDRSGRRSLVVDLDDTATALDLGLLTPARASQVLRTTDETVRAIEAGEFPFKDLVRGQAACKELGWAGSG
jgi:predicted RNA-binding protein associated with RNAse of E/G family